MAISNKKNIIIKKLIQFFNIWLKSITCPFESAHESADMNPLWEISTRPSAQPARRYNCEHVYSNSMLFHKHTHTHTPQKGCGPLPWLLQLALVMWLEPHTMGKEDMAVAQYTPAPPHQSMLPTRAFRMNRRDVQQCWRISCPALEKQQNNKEWLFIL